MGKGDKKSRRGKIIIGSTGVRRPKNKPKAIVKAEAAAVEVVAKVKKVAEKPKAEPKPKVKVAETGIEKAAEIKAAPVKVVKKAVTKTKAEDAAK